MIRYSQLRIRSKVTLALAATALFACLLASAALFLMSRLTLEARVRQTMEPYAQLVSVGAEAAVAFQDPTRAGEILATLRANPQILEAAIILRDGHLLAEYLRPDVTFLSPPPRRDGVSLDHDHAVWTQGLADGASLRLVMSLEELKRQTRDLLQMFAAGMLVLVVVLTFALRLALHRTIVSPISTLAQTVEQVRARADYRRRVPASGEDEVAQLGRGFNAMMQGIEQRDDELQRLNTQLEERVAIRTAELKAANDELEAFSYSVSHDLRAPLRHIDGYVQLLMSRYRAGLPSEGLHYMERVVESAQRMGTLIDDLLRLSRTARAEMRRELVDMNQVLREALLPLKETCATRSIEWSIEDLPAVCGDAALLRQVWANLLGNAIKYTGKRGVAHIRVESRMGDGETVFVVSDDGVGFDMKYAGKLFGVFQRLHSQEEFEGTGIGLATIQRIVRRHGGRAWAEGEQGRGAAFFFALPNRSASGRVSDGGSDNDQASSASNYGVADS